VIARSYTHFVQHWLSDFNSFWHRYTRFNTASDDGFSFPTSPNSFFCPTRETDKYKNRMPVARGVRRVRSNPSSARTWTDHGGNNPNAKRQPHRLNCCIERVSRVYSILQCSNYQGGRGDVPHCSCVSPLLFVFLASPGGTVFCPWHCRCPCNADK